MLCNNETPGITLFERCTWKHWETTTHPYLHFVFNFWWKRPCYIFHNFSRLNLTPPKRRYMLCCPPLKAWKTRLRNKISCYYTASLKLWLSNSLHGVQRDPCCLEQKFTPGKEDVRGATVDKFFIYTPSSSSGSLEKKCHSIFHHGWRKFSI